MLCSAKRCKKFARRPWNAEAVQQRINVSQHFQKDIPDSCRAQLTVQLHREYDINWGIGISGGSDRGYKPFISCIQAGSVADRSDSLLIGDQLLEVNGIRVTTLSHNEILNILKNAGDSITLTLAYNQGDLRYRSSRKCTSKTCELILDKEEPSLGFVIRGGSHDSLSLPITVVSIRPGGLADRYPLLLTNYYRMVQYTIFRHGRLRIGDRILSINGVNVENCSLAKALDLLRKAVGTVTLQVGYDVLVIDSLKKSCTRPILLQIEKNPGSDLGLKLNVLEDDQCSARKKFRISEVVPASIADRCGAFNVGDDMLSVDGVALQLSTTAEVQQLLKGSIKSRITVEIQPHGERRQQAAEQNVEGDKAIKPAKLSLTRNSDGYTEIMKNKDICATDCSRTQECSRSPSPGSFAASINGLPYGRICRSEAMQVVLHCAFRGGYGLVFHRYHMMSDRDTAPLFISYIEKGSPAETCGLLQVGDRVLSLNDWCTDLGTAEEANRMIKHLNGPLTLAVEFDVIESVLPNCGIFTVKLAKRTQHLGLMIRGPISYGKGEAVIISDVEIGSVAYRCGTVQPGDQLLTIDNIPLDSCTVEEAIRLLQRSGDVVKLRVKKFCCSYDGSVENNAHTVVYSIKINRKDNPLGISFGHSMDNFGHIIITQLTPGGLAEKTGAIHIGDRLLAINNHPLDRQSLQQVIHLLDQAGDTVALKIGRDLQARNRHGTAPSYTLDCGYHQISNEKLCTPVQSVDSAVESLDECPMNDNLASKTSNSSSLSSNNPDTLLQDGNRLRNVLDAMKSMPERRCSPVTQEEQTEKRTSRSDPCLDEWNKVLEALESMGEPETLQKLEDTILAGAVPRINSAKPLIPPPRMPKIGLQNVLLCETNTMVKRSAAVSRAIHQIGTKSSSIPCCSNASDTKSVSSNHVSHYELIPHFASERAYFNQANVKNNFHKLPKMSASTISTDLPEKAVQKLKVSNELHSVVLQKDTVYNDFGFSISDGLVEKGIFVHELRTGGPAEQSGNVHPLDRIIRVNQISLQDIDCLLAAPLLASCGDKVELLLSRPVDQRPTESGSNSQCQCSKLSV